MSEDDLLRLRREMYEKASEAQIEMLKGLRGELVDRRWQIILDIDGIREMIMLALAKTEDKELKRVLSDVKDKLDQIEKLIARIPDDFIPAF
jgi:malate/lactate dehydrogenase